MMQFSLSLLRVAVVGSIFSCLFAKLEQMTTNTISEPWAPCRSRAGKPRSEMNDFVERDDEEMDDVAKVTATARDA